MAVVIDGLTYLTVECPQLCDGQSCRVRVDLYSLSGIIFWRIKMYMYVKILLIMEVSQFSRVPIYKKTKKK